MSNKYTTLYSYCDVCDSKIDGAKPYSTYTCVDCYVNAIENLESFDIFTSPKTHRFFLNKEMSYFYGVGKDEEVIKIKLKPIPINSKDVECNDTIYGFFNFKNNRHSCIFKGHLSFKVACNFNHKSIANSKQSLICKYEICY